MLNINYRYDQNSTRLMVEGVPDSSLGQDKDKLGILSTWKLQILGFPELEGKREHLQHLMSVIYPYSRYVLSGVKRSFGEDSSPIRISPNDKGHKIVLKSSQQGIDPLELVVDDAELSDLIFCLDMLLEDKRVTINWEIPYLRPLSKAAYVQPQLILKRFIPPFFGGSLLIIFSFIYLLVPVTKDQEMYFKNNTSDFINDR